MSDSGLPALKRFTNIESIFLKITGRLNVNPNAVTNLVQSNKDEASGQKQIKNMVEMTQADYDALPVKDANTFYVIVG